MLSLNRDSPAGSRRIEFNIQISLVSTSDNFSFTLLNAQFLSRVRDLSRNGVINTITFYWVKRKAHRRQMEVRVFGNIVNQ